MSNQLQVSGEAKIRAIQGPVVANSGVITALDGDASEYVRGDGTLADFPTSTGGGSSVSYYLNTSVSQGTIGGVAYKQLSKVPISGAGTDVTISANGYIASYITDANDPALLEVPAGNFNCEFYFSVNSNSHNPYVYAELYKYDGTTFTLLGSNVAIPQYLTNGTTLSAYYFAIPVATSVLTVTDRISIRIYVNVDGRTVTLHTENNHLCQVVTTFSKGLISLNNLTRQNQFFATGTSGTDFAISSATATHTFNLPVASAANTGKLSSTDWSTFNNKQNLLTNPVTGTGSDGRVAFWTGASSISSDANLYYDYSTDRLGIGTNTPNASLGILNASSTGIQVRTSDSANQYQANIFYDASYGMVYGYNRLGTGTASNLTFFNNIGGFISIPESATNNIGFNTLNPQGLAGASVYDFTSLNTNVELRLHNSSTGYTSSDGSFVRVTSTALVIANAESSQSIFINNGGLEVITINGTNKVAIGSVGVVPMTQQLTVIGSIEAYGGSIYQTVTSSMLKANASGQIIAAIAGTDYLAVGSAVTSVSATSPILSSGGTTPNISIPAATTSVSGYLTSTDWTTFNNKGTFSLPSLTSGSVLFSNGSTIAQDNANFFWDDVNNRLGIGTSSPTEILHIVGGSAIVYIDGNSAGTQTSATLRLRTGGFNVGNFRYNVATDNIEISNVSAGGAVTSGAVKIYGTSGSTTGLTIAAAGGGTFASTLTVGTTAFVTNDIFIGDTTSGSGRFFITDSSNQGITLRRTAATGDRFKMFVGNGTTYTQDNCIILGTNTDIDFYTGSSPVKRLTIGNGGESTFSGGVTSASFFNVLKNGSDSGFSGPYIAVSNAANNVTWGWQLGASNQLALFSYASSTIKNPLNITITGNVGIGTSSPDTKLSIQRPSGNFGIVNGIGFKDQGGTTVAGIGIEGANTNDMQIMGSVGIRFYTNSDLSSTNERMRISSAGYTKISNNGTYINNSLYYHEIRQSGDDWILAATCTSATDPRGIYLAYPSMSPNSSSAFFLYCEDSTATRFYISSDGYVHSRSTSIVIISSDENLKKDITDYDKGLSEVLAMKPRYYRYKAEPEKLQIGFIAQEMDEALKGSMIDSNEKNEETGENYKTYQVEWYPLLVKAIQEQNQMITSLQEQINELKNK